jgi:hypothetical protein
LINQLFRTQNWDRSKLNWGISYNIIEGSMPDRVQNIFRKEANGFHYQVSQHQTTIDIFKTKRR